MDACVAFVLFAIHGQDFVAQFSQRTRNIDQRFRTFQSDFRDLPDEHFFDQQFSANESHGADVAGNVKPMVDLFSHAFFATWVLANGYCCIVKKELYRPHCS